MKSAVSGVAQSSDIDLVWGFGTADVSDSAKVQAAQLINRLIEQDETLKETVRVRVYRSRSTVKNIAAVEELSERYIVVFLAPAGEELSPKKNQIMVMLIWTGSFWTTLQLKQSARK